GEAIDAAVLAAAVRVDREIEVEIGRVVAAEDRLDALLDHLRFGAEPFLLGLLVERSPAVVVALAGLARVAMLDRPDRPAPLGRHARRLLGARRLVARDRALPGRGLGRHTVNIYSSGAARGGPICKPSATIRPRPAPDRANTRRFPRHRLPSTSIDPVCGMTVATDSPHVHEHHGEPVYFCCAGCKAKFVADPERYMEVAVAVEPMAHL